VPNSTASWYEALSRLIRDATLRRRLAAGGLAQLLAAGTLERQAGAWPAPMRR
jgi:hypothetical protein